MKDRIELIGLVVFFASMIVFQITTVFGLLKRAPRMHALFGAVVPPLAVYYAYREGLRVRAIGLGVSLVFYVALRIISHF